MITNAISCVKWAIVWVVCAFSGLGVLYVMQLMRILQTPMIMEQVTHDYAGTDLDNTIVQEKTTRK